MSEAKLESPVYKNAFVEVLRVSNGYAVYDVSVRYNNYSGGSTCLPIAVFEKKANLLKWLDEKWEDKPGL